MFTAIRLLYLTNKQITSFKNGVDPQNGVDPL